MAFDDDDNPLTTRPPAAASAGDDAPTAAEDALEDEVPDYKLFSALAGSKKGLSSKTIRRGEKDFEAHGTRAQDSALESSRQAMEDVLGHTRVHRGDSWVRAWYFPDYWAAEAVNADGLRLGERSVVVENAKGSWLKDVGRVNPAARDPGGAARLWLLPEEALYLVERGTIDLWWPERPLEELVPKTGPWEGREGYGPDDYDVGIPLSLEAAYAMLIGEEGERGKVTLPKYQVYTHLRRGGFYVLRAPPPSPPPVPSSSAGTLTAVCQWLFSLIRWNHQPSVAPWGPLIQPGLYRSYRAVYHHLAIMPRHKPVSNPPRAGTEPEDPYRVFYHVWKTGGAPFSKRFPPPPDFRLAVTDTSTSSVPDLQQLDALLQSSAPHDALPEGGGPGKMYQRLRHGHRSVLVAVVDHGLVNFMRFAEGAFGEERLFERFDWGMRGGRKGGGARGRGGGGGRGRGRGRR
ncbi:tRNA-splicing endonuclease subunit tsp-like protein [Hapsidospora chrysogenum ATCC 11550]|uniref:tRNA-splicing endonuclease subunit tsp-like protein n=1 Tax=Hapsidospora chrysogenum (strain ATCC 11550 / CBS 779.69 / DSM 880 / IAM 14645 / JCM 23072 / IMI 49137) TaxID=857340 RepID=A0A086TBK4_HAPC1|nr:tRNA-splicing endonuclease subunit tsp-like protein [Hapsidospora chrysogenum ATCC 11550]